MHYAPTVGGGAFIIPEMSGRPVGPELRFWVYGRYAQANDGSKGQFDPPWLLGGGSGKIPGAPADHFWLFQANWMGTGIVGCALDYDSPRTVVELSYAFEENRPTHYTGYLIASVAFVGGWDFNFDRVVDGNAGGAFVRMAPVPPPRPLSAATVSAARSGFMEVALAITDAKSYGDGGAPNLIAGYELLYKNDNVPTTSEPSFYRPVLDATNPTRPLGRVPFGAGTVRVAVPTPQKASYFVTRLVYDDPTPLYSVGTSGNSDPVAPPGEKEAADPSPTPTPGPGAAEATPAPTPDAVREPDGEESRTAETASPRLRSREEPGTTATPAALRAGESAAAASGGSQQGAVATSIAAGPASRGDGARVRSGASTSVNPGLPQEVGTQAERGSKGPTLSDASSLTRGPSGGGPGAPADDSAWPQSAEAELGSRVSVPLGTDPAADSRRLPGIGSKDSLGANITDRAEVASPGSPGERGNVGDSTDGGAHGERDADVESAHGPTGPRPIPSGGEPDRARPFVVWRILDGAVVLSVGMLLWLATRGRAG